MRQLSLALVLVTVCLGSAFAADDPKLAMKLGPDPAAWQVMPYQGGVLDATTIDADGVPATAPGPNSMILMNKEPIEKDAELLVRFRVTLPVKNVGSGLYLYAGQKTSGAVEANPLFVQLHVYPSAEPESITANLTPMPGEKTGFAWNYTSRQIPLNRLLMPELTRRRLEQDFAAEPTLTKRWLTFRYQLRGNSRGPGSMDGCSAIRPIPKSTRAGFCDCSFGTGRKSPKCRCVNCRRPAIRGLKPSVWNMISIRRNSRASNWLRPRCRAGKSVTVGGVPFAVPAADAQGRNHIDLKPAWLACGLVEGGFDPAYGDLARWQGAMVRGSGRIQFRIPNGQYTKLHLLAAYSGEADTVPTVTAQFYREYAGHPVNFSGKAPAFTVKSTASVPVDLGGGKQGHLHLVTIPLDPNGPVSFHNQRHLELELTKELQIYRAFPDPHYYSMHGGGLPSGVHVFGMTLERPAVEVDFQPDQVGHIWTAPISRATRSKLTNTTDKPQSVESRTDDHQSRRTGEDGRAAIGPVAARRFAVCQAADVAEALRSS